jgi:hypothetical protein
MTLVPDVPRGRADVEGDADAFDAHIAHAPEDAGPDENGITLLADVTLHGRRGGSATIRVRGLGDGHCAAIVARGAETELVHLEEGADGSHAADIAVAAGETVHLAIVMSPSETAMARLEEQVSAGGFGMGREVEGAMEPPAEPPLPDIEAPLAPPAVPEADFEEASDTAPVGAGPGDGGVFDDVVIGGGGGRDFGLAPAEDQLPPADQGVAPGTAAPEVDGSAPIDAHVAAQMPADLYEGIPFDVVVTLSREAVKIPKGTAGDDKPVKFHKHRAIRIAVQATGFDVAPEALAEVVAKLPARGAPNEYAFRLVPGEPGIGRVVVTVTQEPEVTPLATIALSTRILSADEAPATPTLLTGAPNRAETTAAAPPRALAELPTLAVEETISRGHSVLRVTAKVGSETATNTICLLDKPTYVDGVYETLAGIRDEYRRAVAGGVPAKTAVARAEESLRELGTGIATTILGDEVNALLWKKRRLLAQLMVQTSGELDIPWEIVHLVRVGDADQDDASHFLGDKGLTRWLWGTKRPTTLAVGRGRAVAIAPDYADDNLKLEATRWEVEALEEALQDKTQTAVTRDEVRRRIGAGFDLLHFAGHGRWRSADPRAQEIALAAFVEAQDDGSASYRDVDAREDLPVSESAPFVFLSACDVGRLQHGTAGLGGFAEAFLLGGAGVFIGCNWAVRDDVTAEFAKTLYTELLVNHATLGDAASAARSATRAAHDLTALAFTVFADPRARVVRV